MDINYLTLNKRINNSIHKINDCFIRQCNENDYNEIIKVQNDIVMDLKESKNESLFIPTKDEIIKGFLGQDDIYFICAQTPEGICAYSITFFGYNDDYDLSHHFNGEKVATCDTVVVLPEFRGNKLQQLLYRVSENEAKKRKFYFISATISPDNFHSLNNAFEEGFVIYKTIYYDKLKRYIVYKRLF